jgi:hypothetical protein
MFFKHYHREVNPGFEGLNLLPPLWRYNDAVIKRKNMGLLKLFSFSGLDSPYVKKTSRRHCRQITAVPPGSSVTPDGVILRHNAKKMFSESSHPQPPTIQFLNLGHFFSPIVRFRPSWDNFEVMFSLERPYLDILMKWVFTSQYYTMRQDPYVKKTSLWHYALR